jgi:hypothetical protein
VNVEITTMTLKVQYLTKLEDGTQIRAGWCPLSGQKRTWLLDDAMSAHEPKRTSGEFLAGFQVNPDGSG